MSFGFTFHDAAGNKLADSTDYLASVIDIFTVLPSSTGSKTYPDTSGLDLYVVQTREQPSIVTLASGLSLNSVVTVLSDSGPDTILSWSPGISFGTAFPITLLVYGA